MQSASKLSSTCIGSACKPFFTRIFAPKSATASSSLRRHTNQQAFQKSTTNITRKVSTLHITATATTMPASSAAAAAAPATDPKLVKLRHILASGEAGAAVDALIVPSEDPHMSEYPPDCDARRSYISNFDGSAGTVVITSTAAALWTDGRYFLQAEQQLGPEWTLMKAGTPKVPEIHDWLISTLPENARVGIDPSLHTIEAAEKLQKQLAASGRTLVTLSTNPVDAVWGNDRPPPPTAALRVHSLEWAGLSVADKLAAARAEMAVAGAGALAVTMLDEVAWLLNLRGGDVAYNPVFLSYVLVTADEATLFVDASKVGPEVAAHLQEAGVKVQPYGAAFEAVAVLAAVPGMKIWMDPGKVSFAMKTAALEGSSNSTGGGVKTRKRGRTDEEEEATTPNENELPPKQNSIVLEKVSPVSAAKAVKNEAELAGMREAHIRDGVALVKFFSWLEKTIAGGAVLTECQIDEELTARRAAQPGFVELSFPTIAGADANGAIIHYRPLPESCSSVGSNTLLLLDSGGQYNCGTTDITRTVHMGTPTQHQKDCFTAVLKGHIQLDSAVFPEGTPGCALDTLARTALWALGLNYRHGTGHGVGAALNVHEGPQSISSRWYNTTPLLPNMVCSNEPGYYEDGAFGIRIENLFIVVPVATKHKFAGEYYGCEYVTMCPLQKKMIDKEVLSGEEVAWVDAYHRKVLEILEPRLVAVGATEEVEWLKVATAPL